MAQLTPEERFIMAKGFERLNVDEILERTNQVIRFLPDYFKSIRSALEINGVLDYSIKPDPDNPEGLILLTNLPKENFDKLYSDWENLILF